MLNTNILNMNQSTTKVSLSTPSTGIIQRSHPRSRFIRFQKGSEIESTVFPTHPDQNPYLMKLHTSYSEKIYIIVLQVVIFGDNQFLCEYVDEDDLHDE